MTRVKDAGGLKPQALFVGNMLAPNLSNQAHLGVLLADYAGLLGIEAVTVEAAGASGGAALASGLSRHRQRHGRCGARCRRGKVHRQDRLGCG